MEQRQRELRDRLARAKISNVQGLARPEDPDAIFSPLDDYVERRRPITRLFFSIYDNLGALMAINLFTFALTLPLIVVLSSLLNALATHKRTALLLPLVAVALIAPPAWAAASSYCAKTVEQQPHSVTDYWRDYRRFFVRGILLAVGQWAVGYLLFYAMTFYLGQRVVPLKLIGIVSFYLILLWALMGLYVWPLMVRGYRWRAIIRNAFVLVAAAPLRSISILLVLLIIGGLLAITGIGLVLLVFALWAMLPNQAMVLTRERLEKRAAGAK